MAKRKKNNRLTTGADLPPSALARQVSKSAFWTPRRCVIASMAALFLLWLIQFAPLLSGNAHFGDDVIHQDYPFRVFARNAILSGEFPFWAPFAHNGMPFFAQQTPGVLYPFNIALSLLPVSDDVFWYLLQACVAIHFLIAGAAMFAYLRYKRRSRCGSLFGAAAFMLGGFLVGHAVHTMMVYIMAWFPIVMLLYERCARELKPRLAVWGGLLLGMTMLAGHPQIFFYQLLFMTSVGAYILWSLRERAVKRALMFALFFAVAAGICVVVYLPTIELNNWTARSDYTITEASQGSLQFIQVLAMLAPKIFGAYTGDPAIPPFWLKDAFPHGHFNYWETCFYLGVSTLLLSIFYFRKVKTNRAALFALIWMGAAFCIALGGNFFVYRALFDLGVPGFTSFRHPARILFPLGIILPLAAAVTIDTLNEIKVSSKLKAISLFICAAFAFVGFVIAAGGLSSFLPQISAIPNAAEYASRQGLILVMNAALIGAVLIMFFKDVVPLSAAKILIVICLAVDILSFASGYHIARRPSAPNVFKKASVDIGRIKSMQEKEMFRFSVRRFDVTPGTRLERQTSYMLTDRNAGMTNSVHLLEGYTTLRPKHHIPPLKTENLNTALDLLNVKYYVNPDLRRGNRDSVLTNSTYLPRAKLFYNAKIIDVNRQNDYDSLVLGYMDSDQYDHHNEVVVTDKKFAGYTGGQTGDGSVNITKYKLNSIELNVNTDKEAILWMSEIYYPAWKAFVNGQRVDVHRANYSFRAIIVPPGKSTVVFKFDSGYFNIGMIISLLTLIASIVYLLIERRRRAVTPPPSDSKGIVNK